MCHVSDEYISTRILIVIILSVLYNFLLNLRLFFFYSYFYALNTCHGFMVGKWRNYVDFFSIIVNFVHLNSWFMANYCCESNLTQNTYTINSNNYTIMISWAGFEAKWIILQKVLSAETVEPGELAYFGYFFKYFRMSFSHQPLVLHYMLVFVGIVFFGHSASTFSINYLFLTE